MLAPLSILENMTCIMLTGPRVSYLLGYHVHLEAQSLGGCLVHADQHGPGLRLELCSSSSRHAFDPSRRALVPGSCPSVDLRARFSGRLARKPASQSEASGGNFEPPLRSLHAESPSPSQADPGILSFAVHLLSIPGRGGLPARTPAALGTSHFPFLVFHHRFSSSPEPCLASRSPRSGALRTAFRKAEL